jgi:hypothetical protein
MFHPFPIYTSLFLSLRVLDAHISAALMDTEVASSDFKRMGWLYSKIAPLDPDPFNIVYGFAVHVVAHSRGQEEPALAIHHKALALQKVNKRLQDPKKATTDANIGAVACLAAHELCATNPSAFRAHMSGLDHMMHVRGGILGLENNKPLQNAIQYLDLGRAYIFSVEPKYSAYDPEAITGYVGEDENFLSMRAKSAEMRGIHEFSSYILKCIDGLEMITTMIKRSAAIDPGLENWTGIQLLLCSTFCQILWQPPQSHYANMIPRKWNSIRLGGLVYLLVALHELYSLPGRTEIGRFQRALSHRLIDEESDWGRAIKMFIKVLLKDQHTASQRHKRGWYIANAIVHVQEFGPATWDTIEMKLREYIMNDEERRSYASEIPEAVFKLIKETCMREYEPEVFGVRE